LLCQVGEKPRIEKVVGQVLLGIATSIALLVNDAGLVIGLNGALMGSAIVYIYPSLMFLSHTADKKTKIIQQSLANNDRKCYSHRGRLKLERFASRLLIAFGAFSGILGACVSVVNSCSPHLLR